MIARSYWTSFQSGNIMSYGTHADVLERQSDGRWLFRDRVIRHIHPA